jgi:hypothetical protein
MFIANRGWLVAYQDWAHTEHVTRADICRHKTGNPKHNQKEAPPQIDQSRRSSTLFWSSSRPCLGMQRHASGTSGRHACSCFGQVSITISVSARVYIDCAPAWGSGTQYTASEPGILPHAGMCSHVRLLARESKVRHWLTWSFYNLAKIPCRSFGKSHSHVSGRI